MHNGAHPIEAVFRRRGGVVPEIVAIHITIIEPVAGMVGMIDAFAGFFVEGPASGDVDATCGAQWVKDRFFEAAAGFGKQIGREVRIIDENINAFLIYTIYNLNV